MEEEDEKRLLSFGEPVVEAEFLELLQSRLFEQLCSTGAPHIFPGGQPVSFEARHLAALQAEDYYVCEKSDGVRYLLYFCRPPSGPAAFLIDRNYKFRYLGGLELPRKDGKEGCQEETLLDGELLIDTFRVDEHDEQQEEDIYQLDDEEVRQEKKKKTKKVMSFMIFDCLLVDGLNVMGEPLPGRLKHVQNDVILPLKKFDDWPFTLLLKTMYKPYHMGHLFSQVIPALPHGNDGLVFTPVQDAYRSGTCPRMLKWKPAHMNTVDFRLAKNNNNKDGQLVLQVAQQGNHQDYCPFEPEPEDREAWLRDPPLGKILECRYDPGRPAAPWRFVRFREDKVMANAVHVVQKIIDSIGDNVKQEQLVKACDRIKVAWEQRHPEELKAKRTKIN